MRKLDICALIISIIGGINWLLVGLFKFDLVAAVCGGETSAVSRIIYTVVGLAALWLICTLVRYCNATDK